MGGHIPGQGLQDRFVDRLVKLVFFLREAGQDDCHQAAVRICQGDMHSQRAKGARRIFMDAQLIGFELVALPIKNAWIKALEGFWNFFNLDASRDLRQCGGDGHSRDEIDADRRWIFMRQAAHHFNL